MHELSGGPVADYLKENWPSVKKGDVIEVKNALNGLKEDAHFVVVKADLLDVQMSVMVMDYEFLRIRVTKKSDKFVWSKL